MPQIIPNWHPIFVHFTVALLFVSSVLHVFAAMLSPVSPSRAQMALVARWNLWLGFLVSVGTAAAGFVAFDSVVHDDASHAAMKVHRNFALATLALYLPFVITSAIDAVRNRLASGAFAFALLVPTLLLVLTAWRGGELVYRYGLGVQSLPKVEAHHHDHEHAHGPVESAPPTDAAPASTGSEVTALDTGPAPPATEEQNRPAETNPATEGAPTLPEATTEQSSSAAAGLSTDEHSHGETDAPPHEHGDEYRQGSIDSEDGRKP
ncbi:MAG: DUF2231 domain-containing protein [Chromatiales bacterium]